MDYYKDAKLMKEKKAFYQEYVFGKIPFEIPLVVFLSWFATGVLLDSWAHSTFGDDLETFFTPWHAVMYTGFTAVAAYLYGVALRNYLKTGTIKKSFPFGYEFAYIGVLFFMVGGAGDFVWHELFGFEADIEAQYSPTHLFLGIGLILIWSSPLRAAWKRTDLREHVWKDHFVMLISTIFTLVIFTFFTAAFHPFLLPLAINANKPIQLTLSPGLRSYFIYEALGMAAIILSSVIFSGMFLLILKRFELPLGALTIIFIAYTTIISLIKGYYFLIPVGTISGILIESLYHILRPFKTTALKTRIFAFSINFILFFVYFIALILLFGVWWSIHLWLGAPFLAGITGLLISYLIIPIDSEINQ